MAPLSGDRTGTQCGTSRCREREPSTPSMAHNGSPLRRISFARRKSRSPRSSAFMRSPIPLTSVRPGAFVTRAGRPQADQRVLTPGKCGGVCEGHPGAALERCDDETCTVGKITGRQRGRVQSDRRHVDILSGGQSPSPHRGKMWPPEAANQIRRQEPVIMSYFSSARAVRSRFRILRHPVGGGGAGRAPALPPQALDLGWPSFALPKLPGPQGKSGRHWGHTALLASPPSRYVLASYPGCGTQRGA